MKEYIQSTLIPAIRRWLAPPVFDGEPEKTRRADLLNLFAIVGLLLTLLSIVGIVLGRNVPVRILMFDVGFFFALLLFRHLLHRGKLGPMMFFSTVLIFVHLTSLNVSLGTIRTPTAAMYLLWMITMGLLFQWRGIVMSTVASSLAIFGLIMAENAGLLPQPNYSVGITQWIVSTAMFGMTAALTHYVNQITRLALERAKHEIEQRGRMEAELRQSRDEWKRTFDAMADLIFIIDDKQNILRINKAASNALGISEDEVQSVPCYVRMHGTDKPPANCPHLKSLRDHDTHQVDVLVERFGQHYQVTTTPIIDADGHYEASVHVAHDISERLRYERELEEARQAADAASRAKSEFLSSMSHELRTPMNGVLGMAQLLVKPQLQDDKRIQYAQTILNAGHTLLSLLNDILDLSKVEAGKLKLESIAFAVDTLVGDIQALFAETASAKGLQLDSTWQGPAGPCYLGDPYRLRQMLSNLVGNAIKFTAHGFVRIVAIEIERDSQHAVLLFSVSDSGMGISDEQQSRLFQAFSQADSSTTRQFGGTGLGLSIVLQLAKLMGGEVGIDSQPGQGARFWFRVNVLLRTDEQESLQTTAVAVLASDLTGTVLIAEDNLVNRMVIMAMLGELGCSGLTVTVVEDGQQALDYITQGVALPDLVLMDVQMPVMGGLEATEKIRLWQADQGKPRVPIVALTANAFEEDRQQCLAAGMDDFMVKPLDLLKLRAMLVRWLGVKF
jgi:PAS domain S-box-containing protein